MAKNKRRIRYSYKKILFIIIENDKDQAEKKLISLLDKTFNAGGKLADEFHKKEDMKKNTVRKI